MNKEGRWGWKGAKRGATLAVQVLFSFIARLNLWLGSPVLRFILSCRAPMTNGFPRVAIARRVGGEEKKSALFERNEGRNRCNGPRFDAQ